MAGEAGAVGEGGRGRAAEDQWRDEDLDLVRQSESQELEVERATALYQYAADAQLQQFGQRPGQVHAGRAAAVDLHGALAKPGCISAVCRKHDDPPRTRGEE